jgi:hypothetical protein
MAHTAVELTPFVTVPAVTLNRWYCALPISPMRLIIAAGRLLAERLGITEDSVSWQSLELNG